MNLRLAWRNLGRNKKRTGLAILAIAVGQFSLIFMSSLMHGYADNIRLSITGPMIGHLQVHEPDWREERAMDLVIDDVEVALKVIRSDSAVRNAGARIYAPVLAAPEDNAFTAIVVGVDTEAESQGYGLLSGLDGSLGEKEVLIGYMLAREMGAEPGQEIAVIGQAADDSLANDLYIVRDIVKGPSDLVNQSGIVMNLKEAQELFVMSGQAHEIVVRTVESGQAESLVSRLEGKPEFEGTEVLDWKKIVPELVMILDMSDWIGYIVVFIVFIAAIAGITNTLVMSTFERMHEFGMLLALGCRPGRILKMIVIEAVMLGALGVALGTAAGLALTGWLAHTGLDMALWGGSAVEDMAYKGLNLPLNIHPRFELADLAIGLSAVMVTSLLACIWPALIAARLEPTEAMRA